MGHTAAVVLAGGRGTRVGADRNKVLLEVAGRAVIDWSVRAFATSAAIERTVLVAHPDDRAALEALAADYQSVVVITGGQERADSERAALEHLRSDILAEVVTSVLLHDGARPCVSHALISQAAAIAAECGVLPTLAAPLLARESHGALLPEPGRLVRAQTPQGGPSSWLIAAYDAALRSGFVGTDTASYLEQAGYPVRAIDGDRRNLKITYRTDLAEAAATLAASAR